MITVSVRMRVKPSRAEEFATGIGKLVDSLEQVDGTFEATFGRLVAGGVRLS